MKLKQIIDPVFLVMSFGLIAILRSETGSEFKTSLTTFNLRRFDTYINRPLSECFPTAAAAATGIVNVAVVLS